MKLRIRGQELRIRTDPEDMRVLAATGKAEDRIELAPNRALIYRLTLAPGLKTLRVAFEDNAIEVLIPEGQGRRWCSTDLEGLAGRQRNGAVELSVSLEKDFDPSE